MYFKMRLHMIDCSEILKGKLNLMILKLTFDLFQIR